MFLFTTMGMGWTWEYGHGKGREWDRKGHSRTHPLFRFCYTNNFVFVF